MSRHPALLLLLMLGSAAGLRGQVSRLSRTGEAADLLTAERRRVADLERTVALRDSARDAATGWLHLAVPPMIIEVMPPDTVLVMEAAHRAAASLQQRFGMLARIGATRIRVWRDSTGQYGPGQWVAVERRQSAGPEQTQSRRRVSRFSDPDTLASPIEESAADPIWSRLAGAFHPWHGVIVPGVEALRAREQVYIALATSPIRLGRDCLDGDLDACAMSLGLRDSPSVVHRLRPEERQLLVRALGYLTGGEGSYDRCAAGGQASCDSILQVVDLDRVRLPANGDGPRQLLVRLAMQQGGPEALTRLAATTNDIPLGRRLALAAGTDEVALLAAWRAAVLGARPRPVTLRVAEVLSSGFWVALLILLALRSTRWR